MATGLEMFDALDKATKPLERGSIFEVNPVDALDLRKLTEDDLVGRGFSAERAKKVDADLLRGNLDELGKALGIHLRVNKHKQNLIPGEALKRAAESLKDDPSTLEEDLLELDKLRHPERYAG
jgi:hypothetical protein